MKSGSLQFEFEVEVNRNILVLIQLTELIIKTDISKTSCFTFGGKALTYKILV